jgi:hypothetical protein
LQWEPAIKSKYREQGRHERQSTSSKPCMQKGEIVSPHHEIQSDRWSSNQARFVKISCQRAAPVARPLALLRQRRLCWAAGQARERQGISIGPGVFAC